MRARLLVASALCACSGERLRLRADDAVQEMDLPRAERLYRSALARRPGDADALYGLGWTYHLAGHPEQARQAFARCVQETPGHARCLKGLGSVALSEGDFDGARARFEQALALAPQDASVQNSLALLDLRVGRLEEALAAYDRLCGSASPEPAALIGRAETLLRLGREEEALASVDLALGGDELRPREQVLASTLRARILLESTSGRLDPERCAETAPPLFAWLDEARSAAECATGLGLDYPEANDVARQVHQRRLSYEKLCPGGRPSGAMGK